MKFMGQLLSLLAVLDARSSAASVGRRGLDRKCSDAFLSHFERLPYALLLLLMHSASILFQIVSQDITVAGEHGNLHNWLLSASLRTTHACARQDAGQKQHET
jgi:hypothetical protein